MLSRAYSVLHVKAVDAERRVITGVATSPETDRMGDIIEPLGVSFKNPLPLLLFHDSKNPVGIARFQKPTKDGIAFEATISQIDEPGKLQDNVNHAWQLVKNKLVRAVSIGFRPLNDALDFMQDTGGIRFRETEVLELSLVTVPANEQATIHTIKSLDAPYLAASGIRSSVPLHSPGVSGQRKATSMTTSEQLTAEKSNLQIKMARLEELMNQDNTDGGLDEDASNERDTLSKEVPSLTVKVQRLSAMEAAQAALGQTVSYHAPNATRIERSLPRVEVAARPKGQIFTRYAMAVAAGKGSMSDTLAYAKRFTDTPEVLAYVKAVEGTSVVSSPAWGGELVNPSTVETEFVELLRPATIIGRIQGLRTVPFNIPIITQTGGSTFEWVGEGAAKPVGELSFTRDTLGYSKAAGIIVLADELVRLSRPNAEEAVRTDMIEQCAKFLDEQFTDTTVAAGSDHPASITYGVASPAATGADLDSFKLDFYTALKTFTAAGIPPSGLVVITTSTIALGLSMYTNPLGQVPAGFAVTPQGGTLFGFPVIPSDSVPSGLLIIAKPSEIFLADDGRVTLDASNQARLDMAGGNTPAFSLWQKNCTGIRAERWIRWQKRRAGAVAVIDTASYGPSVGSP